MSPTLAAVLIIGIFVLAAALIWLGLGLARRAQRLEETAPPPGADGNRAATAVATPSRPAPPARPAPGLRDRLGKTRAALARSLGALTGRRTVDDEAWDSVEEALLVADVGVTTTSRLIDELRARAAAERVDDPAQLVAMLRTQIVDDLAGRDRSLHHAAGGPTVWLFVGVNGTGKTTTIAKLARREIDDGHPTLMAAADTFRAAAADQLAHWADRVGADVVRGQEGADPGSVVFDAVDAAGGRGAGVVLVDTAGRMHTKVNLMEELKKIRRIAERRPGALQEVLLVIDATTGQNGLTQARQFADAVDVTGVVLTKLDGTAKGGIVLAIEADLGIPVKLIGVGEAPEDLVPFDPEDFTTALFA
ncbi:MAG TPA: signal recognition particle-docking protein FtsY [Acidimicrobiia bacterium]|nr:signal recognition particle-docking protein FtsY [Acidimicrobiia bacterium]